MSVTYAINAPVEPAEVAALYSDAGLNRPVQDIGRIELMLRHANLVVTARDGDRLVGIARSLTDFSWTCYLADLAVASDRQRQGIGKELIRLTRESLGEEVTLHLVAAAPAADYYAPLGFVPLERAWKIPRVR